jgi:hypothetical protein
MIVYELAIETFVPMLKTLATLLEKGAEHARATGTETEILVDARLAADMFPLSTQVQLACHHARDAAARLTGKTPHKIDNKNLTLNELMGLVKKTVEQLDNVKEAAFAGAERRKIEMPLQGRTKFRSNGLQFLRDWSIPNFYFHVVTAYDILRYSGVDVGKRDYLAHIAPYIRQGGEP